MTTRTIESDADLRGLQVFLAAQAMPFTVNVTKGKKRSLDQNRLQRLLINEIAEQDENMTAEEWRGYLKLTVAVPILRAENEDFCTAYDEHIKGLPYETKLACMMEPLDFPCTRLFTTKQFTTFLDTIYRDFSEKGFQLTEPEH